MKEDIIGTWKLISFDILPTDASLRPWGTNVRGLLFYSTTGHMSVAINRDLTDSGNKEKDVQDSLLFYAGTFSLKDGVVSHHVTVASNPGRIGKEMVRYMKLDGDVLTLISPPENFGTAIVKWQRISGGSEA